MEASFQAVAAFVDVSDTDSARVRTTAWRRLNSSCTQLRHVLALDEGFSVCPAQVHDEIFQVAWPMFGYTGVADTQG